MLSFGAFGITTCPSLSVTAVARVLPRDRTSSWPNQITISVSNNDVPVWILCFSFADLGLAWLELSYRVYRRFAAVPRRTAADFINNGVKFINPLMFVIGWAPERIVFCEMHVVHLGICQWLNASAVILLAKFQYLGPGSLNDQLQILTFRLNTWCRLNRIRPRGGILILSIQGK